jgi:hypothetical protein
MYTYERSKCFNVNFNVYFRIHNIIKSAFVGVYNQFIIYINKGGSHSLSNNYMFRPPYRPSSGCTPSYYKSNHTIYSAPVFVDEISFTFIKCPNKIITVALDFKTFLI